MKASKQRQSKEVKLQNIEDQWYDIGLKCVASFEQNNDIVSIRGGTAAHRCAMQAMRDQMRYNIAKK